MDDRLMNRHLPDMLAMKDGRRVTANSWPERRREVAEILCNELNGILPDVPYALDWNVEKTEDHFFMGGKGCLRVIRLTVRTQHGEHTFRAYLCLPKAVNPAPVFVMASFGRMMPVDTIPVEEILDEGFGLCMYACPEVTSDDGDFSSGLAGLFYPDGERTEHDGGKIAIWAWAASRIADALLTMPDVDPGKLMVVGHSRLGKTALWAGAMDTRFQGVVSVQSGCAGASLARYSAGERVGNITGNFPFWFAKAYAQYTDRESAMPFDQHYLLALIAPRPLYVTSAAGDLWADPLGEYLGCLAVSEVYELLGKKGVRNEDSIADDCVLHDGDVGYSRRPGNHFFSRMDWQRICAFMREKL